MEIDHIIYTFAPSMYWNGRTPDEYAIVTPWRINKFMAEILRISKRITDAEARADLSSVARRFVAAHVFGQKALADFDHDAGDRLDRVFVDSWRVFKESKSKDGEAAQT